MGWAGAGWPKGESKLPAASPALCGELPDCKDRSAREKVQVRRTHNAVLQTLGQKLPVEGLSLHCGNLSNHLDLPDNRHCVSCLDF